MQYSENSVIINEKNMFPFNLKSALNCHLYACHDQKVEMVGNNTWRAFKPKI